MSGRPRVSVTYYPLFVLDLASRHVQILGSTPHPNALFMPQRARTLVLADYGPLTHHRVLLCDRDATWSAAGRGHLEDAGLRVVQTPSRAPNATAHAEHVVRSITEEWLDRLVPIGEQYVRRALAEDVAHDDAERPQQGCGNTLLRPASPSQRTGRIRSRPRWSGLLNDDAPAA